MQSSNVHVVKNAKNGQIITQTANPEFGFFLLEQSTRDKYSNFLSSQRVTKVMVAPMAELKKMRLAEGMEFPGNLFITESLEPINSTSQVKIYPTNHPKAGQPVLSGGQKVYRTIGWDASGKSENTLLPTDRMVAPAQPEATKAGVTAGK